MNLPVADVEAAAAFYERVMGFRVESRNDVPYKSAVLVRDDIKIGLAENGGDPTQDGCAFRVDDVEAAAAEFKSKGLQKEISDLKMERRDDGSEWKVFFVVAPDGLCYWFGQRMN